MVRVHLTPPVFKRSPAHPCRMAGGFFIPPRTKNSHPKNSLFVYPLFFQAWASRLSLASRVCPARRCPRRRLPLDGKTKKCNNLLVKKTTKTAAALPTVFPPPTACRFEGQKRPFHKTEMKQALKGPVLLRFPGRRAWRAVGASGGARSKTRRFRPW